MATQALLADDELSDEARAVFDDIRRTRGSDFINNFWRALAHDPGLLRATWDCGFCCQCMQLLHPFPHRCRLRQGHDRCPIRRAFGHHWNGPSDQRAGDRAASVHGPGVQSLAPGATFFATANNGHISAQLFHISSPNCFCIGNNLCKKRSKIEMEETMTGQFTFKTIRTRRPYFAGPIRRKGSAGRLNFEHMLSAMTSFDVDHQTAPMAVPFAGRNAAA